MNKGLYWMADHMKDEGTEMDETTVNRLLQVAWKKTEKEHRAYMTERIKRTHQKLDEPHRSNRTALVDQTGLPNADHNHEETDGDITTCEMSYRELTETP